MAENHEHDEHQSDLRARIAYLEAALEPGSEINSQTTFYCGKGESMRQELAELRAQLDPEIPEIPEIPLPGDRWQFEHGGYQWDIQITRIPYSGDVDVIHGTLMKDGAHPMLGHKGDLVIVPSSAVRAGHRVT